MDEHQLSVLVFSKLMKKGEKQTRKKLTLKYYKKGVAVTTTRRRHSRHETDSKSNNPVINSHFMYLTNSQFTLTTFFSAFSVWINIAGNWNWLVFRVQSPGLPLRYMKQLCFMANERHWTVCLFLTVYKHVCTYRGIAATTVRQH